MQQYAGVFPVEKARVTLPTQDATFHDATLDSDPFLLQLVVEQVQYLCMFFYMESI